MATFGFYATDTGGMYGGQFYEPIHVAPSLLVVWPLRAWARLMLARIPRPAIPEILAPRDVAAPVLFQRRVVVERGFVGWVRRGSRRPL